MATLFRDITITLTARQCEIISDVLDIAEGEGFYVNGVSASEEIDALRVLLGDDPQD